MLMMMMMVVMVMVMVMVMMMMRMRMRMRRRRRRRKRRGIMLSHTVYSSLLSSDFRCHVSRRPLRACSAVGGRQRLRQDPGRLAQRGGVSGHHLGGIPGRAIRYTYETGVF